MRQHPPPTEAPTPGKRPVVRWIFQLLILLVAIVALQWWQSRPLASGPAPPLQGVLTSGGTVSLDDYRGTPVLVHFWAEWCPICKLEQASIESISGDLPVLSVAMQSGSADAIRRFMAAEGLSFPTLADPRGEIAGAWGVHGVPTSFVVDADGLIRFSTTGLSSESGLRARLWAAGNL